MSSFGKFLKEMRGKRKMTLRQFCRLAGLDPSNWSKVERGRLSPPSSRKVITDIASVLMITPGSEEWKTLFDLAAIGHIPEEFMSGPETEDKIRIMFRLANSPSAPSPALMKQAIFALRSFEVSPSAAPANLTPIVKTAISEKPKKSLKSADKKKDSAAAKDNQGNKD